MVEPNSGPRAYGDYVPIWVFFLNGFSDCCRHDILANSALYMEDDILVIH
jgi:hypothetical protein